MINYNLQLRLESLIPSLGIFFTDIATAANKLKAYIVYKSIYLRFVMIIKYFK